MNKNEIIGKVCDYDIYNDNGLLLLLKYTKITAEHIEWLERHNITLSAEDIMIFDMLYYHNVVNKAVSEAKTVFAVVRHMHQLPMTLFEQNVLPKMSDITTGAHIIDLFISLQAKDDYTYRHNIAC